jgi:hypothetical protein
LGIAPISLHATYRWKTLDKGYNFASDFISIRGLHTKLWACKVVKVPTLGISGPHLGAPRQKWHLGDGLVAMPKYIIRGKVVASRKSKLWWVLWIRVYSWQIRAPKCSNYVLTNLLFSLCKFVWIIELFVNLPSPIPKLQQALYPWSVVNQGPCPIPSPSVIFTFGLTFESFKELGGASILFH